MFNKFKKVAVDLYDELSGWERTSRNLGKKLVETNLKLKEAEKKIVILELALMDGPPERRTNFMTGEHLC